MNKFKLIKKVNKKKDNFEQKLKNCTSYEHESTIVVIT